MGEAVFQKTVDQGDEENNDQIQEKVRDRVVPEDVVPAFQYYIAAPGEQQGVDPEKPSKRQILDQAGQPGSLNGSFPVTEKRYVNCENKDQVRVYFEKKELPREEEREVDNQNVCAQQG